MTIRNIITLTATLTALAVLAWLLIRAVNDPEPIPPEPIWTSIQLPTL